MRRDQVPGALRHRSFQRLVGGPGGVQRLLKLPAGAPAGPHQQDREQQDQQGAGQIDRQQNNAGPPRIAGANAKQPFLLPGEGVEVRDNFFHDRAEAAGAGAAVDGPELEDLMRQLSERFGRLEQPGLAGIVAGAFNQLGEGRRNSLQGLAVLRDKPRIAGERETP